MSKYSLWWHNSDAVMEHFYHYYFIFFSICVSRNCKHSCDDAFLVHIVFSFQFKNTAK